MFLSLVGEVVEQNVFQKERNCFSFMSVYSDSENSEDEPDECFYSPDDSKGSDNVSVKSCIPAQTESTIFIFNKFKILLIYWILLKN